MIARHVTTPKLRELHSLLWRWTGLISTTARQWVAEKDCLWWYTERALVSTLAAAAWLDGGQALEEYSNEKGRGRRNYPGRCDLYLYTGSEEFVAEAKLRWCNVGRGSREGIDGVRDQLAAACDDARLLKGYGARRLGMVFAVPRYPASQQTAGHRLLSEWQARLAGIRAGGLAWSFPLAARELQWKSHAYPGVAVVVREVGRG
jgi:hypothetical protein